MSQQTPGVAPVTAEPASNTPFDEPGRQPASSARAAWQQELVSQAQLGRVLEVPLAVTLRFGSRYMRLREVLELTTGSLVELDRRVEEPVDLLLGERIIARGEVVIVDGNYGLRVTEIVHAPAA